MLKLNDSWTPSNSRSQFSSSRHDHLGMPTTAPNGLHRSCKTRRSQDCFLLLKLTVFIILFSCVFICGFVLECPVTPMDVQNLTHQVLCALPSKLHLTHLEKKLIHKHTLECKVITNIHAPCFISVMLRPQIGASGARYVKLTFLAGWADFAAVFDVEINGTGYLVCYVYFVCFRVVLLFAFWCQFLETVFTFFFSLLSSVFYGCCFDSLRCWNSHAVLCMFSI